VQRLRPALTAAKFAVALLIVSFAGSAGADVKTWADVGEIGGPVLWTVGLGSSLFQDGSLGKAHAARTLDGVIAAGLLTEGLKVTTREPRPYDGGHDSFPSMHASLSFAVASAQAFYHPRQAIFWYGAAAIVSYARVAGHEHHPQDAVAGAALGTGCGRWAVTSPHGLFIGPMFNGHRMGFALAYCR
jgi:membrane-associated phospholipid phosphatase